MNSSILAPAGASGKHLSLLHYLQISACQRFSLRQLRQLRNFLKLKVDNGLNGNCSCHDNVILIIVCVFSKAGKLHKITPAKGFTFRKERQLMS